ncbi:hypothetical protein K788_0003794 [Paraburkholderia caribensis MBA4]|uniref:Uncharacterized protein n=1 Tax=Paraburkholderia caribensis MBA4 TaxID=1323664 RepID=A0A0P0RBD2_9BURK|nr:hypothetical protein K788_0003794 [Paraburkholderia caribensis MBA4]
MSVKIRSNQTLPRGARCPVAGRKRQRRNTKRHAAQRAPERANSPTRGRDNAAGCHANPVGKPRAPFEAHFSSDCHILRVGTVE